MRPIIRWALWERRWSSVFWTLGIAVYIAINTLVYSSLKGQAQTLNHVLKNLSPTTRSLFSDSSDLLSPVGYLASKLYYLILPLLFTMLAVNLANGLLAREEENGTLELLLARPISRSRLLLAKLTAALLVLLGVGSITMLVTIATAAHAGFGIAVLHIIAVTLVMLLLVLLFSSVCWLLIGFGRFGRRASTGITILIALASYLFTSLEGTAQWLRGPAKFLPYHYYRPSDILRGNYHWSYIAGLGIATLVLMSLAFVGFRRRDIGR